MLTAYEDPIRFVSQLRQGGGDARQPSRKTFNFGGSHFVLVQVFGAIVNVIADVQRGEQLPLGEQLARLSVMEERGR